MHTRPAKLVQKRCRPKRELSLSYSMGCTLLKYYSTSFVHCFSINAPMDVGMSTQIKQGFSLSLSYSIIFVLLFLSGCQRITTGSSASRKPVKSKPTETTDWADKRRQRVDFIAVGTSPVATTTEPVPHRRTGRSDGPAVKHRLLQANAFSDA